MSESQREELGEGGGVGPRARCSSLVVGVGWEGGREEGRRKAGWGGAGRKGMGGGGAG